MSTTDGATNNFVLIKSFDHLNSNQASRTASRKRIVKRLQKVLASAQPTRKCEKLQTCFSLQSSPNQHVLFTASNYFEGVFEIDNSFHSRLVVQRDHRNDIYYYSHVVMQRYTVGGFPGYKVNVFDNETKQVVYKSMKRMIDIDMLHQDE